MPINYLQGMAGRFGMGGRGIDPRRRLAEQLFTQGVDTSPAHLGTGIGRLGKALAAAFMMRQSMGQETDAMKWLTAKMPDKTRPPTDEEIMRDPTIANLQMQLPTEDWTVPIPPGASQDDSGGPTYPYASLSEMMNLQPTPKVDWKEAELGISKSPDPSLDVDTEEQRRLFALSRAQGLPMGGPRDPVGWQRDAQAEHDIRSRMVPDPQLPGFDVGDPPYPNRLEKPPTESMDEFRRRAEEEARADQERSLGVGARVGPSMPIAEESVGPRVGRDYAQELASGMKAYRTDKTKQISDPYTRMEWLRESAMGKEGNPFVRRMLQNLMFAEMQRDIGKEDLASERGFKTSERLAGEKFTAGESELDRISKERAAKLRGVGEDPNAWKLWLKADELSDADFEKFLLTRRGYKPRDIGGTLFTPSLSQPGVGVGEEKEITLGPEQELPYIQQKTDIEQKGKLSAKYMDDLTRMQPKAFSALGTFQAKTKFMQDNVRDAISKVSGWSTKWGAKLSGWPGSPAQSLMMVLNTIKSNIGFQALQEMRLNSPTGGALGQVSEKELYYLQSTLGDLSQEQDGAELVRKLNAMLTQVEGMNSRLQSAYDMTFRPLTEAEGGDGSQYTIPFSPGPENMRKKNGRKDDDPYNLGL